ncbi:MAG TPA: hypothetical protein VM030_11400 [Acidimicrobiales bacterium]|nr:hypothetical protein [Acidimicrobiales bacterium]
MHRSTAELAAGVDDVRGSPSDAGRLELIVARPDLLQRAVLEEGRLDPALGLEGDTWSVRPSKRTPDGSPHPDMQLNVMNARAAALFAVTPDRWALAGDQLYVDLDLTPENLPAGTRLQLGSAVIEVTDQPHNGCPKFVERFGADALRFVMSPVGKELRLRGINARVVTAGTVRRGDTVTKVVGR